MHISKLKRGMINVSFLTIGNIVSQATGMIGFIYIARMLGPENYGIYVTVGVFVGMFSFLTLDGINRVVLREGAKDISQMNRFLEKTSGIKNLFALAAIVVCISTAFLLPYSMQLRVYILLFSVDLIRQSFRGFFGAVYQAAERMQYNAGLSILNRIIFVSLSIAFLYMGFGLLALFSIAIFSHAFTLLLSFRLSRRFVVFKFWSRISWDKSILKPAFVFSLIGFLGFLTTKIDLVMISFLGTSEDMGIYGAAYRIAREGVMLRGIVSTAFFPIITKRLYMGSMRLSLLLKYSGMLFLGVFALASIASYFAEDFMIIAFGKQYKDSGYILSILVFYIAIIFATLPFSNAIIATHNEHITLIMNVISAGLNILLNYMLFLRFGLIGIAYSTLLVSGTMGVVGTFVYVNVLKKKGHLV